MAVGYGVSYDSRLKAYSPASSLPASAVTAKLSNVYVSRRDALRCVAMMPAKLRVPTARVDAGGVEAEELTGHDGRAERRGRALADAVARRDGLLGGSVVSGASPARPRRWRRRTCVCVVTPPTSSGVLDARARRGRDDDELRRRGPGRSRTTGRPARTCPVPFGMFTSVVDSVVCARPPSKPTPSALSWLLSEKPPAVVVIDDRARVQVGADLAAVVARDSSAERRATLVKPVPMPRASCILPGLVEEVERVRRLRLHQRAGHREAALRVADVQGELRRPGEGARRRRGDDAVERAGVQPRRVDRDARRARARRPASAGTFSQRGVRRERHAGAGLRRLDGEVAGLRQVVVVDRAARRCPGPRTMLLVSFAVVKATSTCFVPPAVMSICTISVCGPSGSSAEFHGLGAPPGVLPARSNGALVSTRVGVPGHPGCRGRTAPPRRPPPARRTGRSRR